MNNIRYVGRLEPHRLTSIVEELDANPQFWDRFTLRTEAYATPHKQVSDIWVRFRAWEELTVTLDRAKALQNGAMPASQLQMIVRDWVGTPHESVWYEAGYTLGELRREIFTLMRNVEAERLGGVLITRIPPGGKVLPHVDPGWHAQYYRDKVGILLKGDLNQAFCYDDGEFRAPAGTIFSFNNQVAHWVNNDSDQERITAIICFKRDERAMPLYMS